MVTITLWQVIGLAVVIFASLAIIAILLVRSLRLKKTMLKSLHLLSNDNDTAVDVFHLPGSIEKNNQKLLIIADSIRQLTSTAKDDGVHPSLLNDEVGKALLSAQSQMKVLRQEEGERHWTSNGLAQFAEVLRKKESMQEYGALIISAVVKYVGANQGGLFIEYESAEEGGRYLELTGMYAYERRRHHNKRIKPGEGILGQCMFEKELIFLKEIPENYVNITSGLGLATPRNLVVVPLMLNGVFYGAFELASFKILKPHELDFLNKVAVMIASEVSAIKTLERTKVLLAESDELSGKLQSQDEELRLNLEELTAAQEEMQKRQVELERKQAELGSYLSAIDNTIASAEFNTTGRIENANNLFLTLTGFSRSEIRGRHYTELFSNGDNLLVMWENLMLGKFFSGEFRMRDQRNNEQWLNGTLNPIVNSKGTLDKIMLFAQFTTQEKEKLNEVNGMLHALKHPLPVIEFTTDLRCKSANQKFMKLFGVGRLDLKNKSISDFMSTQTRNCFMKAIEDLATRDELQLTVDFHEGSRIRTWEVSVSRLRNLSGDTSRFVMMLINQTDSNLVRLAI